MNRTKSPAKHRATGPSVPASRIYTLKLTPHRAPEVWRTVEMRATDTLANLHAVIQHEFELDNDHLYAFFMTNVPWDRKDVYSISSSGRAPAGDRSPDHAQLGNLRLTVGREFLYIFDFGDELRHAVTVTAISEAVAGVKYPRTIESEGAAPEQYVDWDAPLPYEGPPLAPDLAELAADVRRAYDAYAEAPSVLDSAGAVETLAPLESALADAALLTRVFDAVAGRPEQLGAIDHEADASIDELITEVPFDLASHGRVDDALALLARAAPFRLGSFETAIDRATILADAGRAAEARAETEQLLAQRPNDAGVVDSAATVYEILGDDERVEALSRRVLEIFEAETRLPIRLEPDPLVASEPDPDADDITDLYEIRDEALSRLAELRRKQGDEAGALAFEAELEGPDLEMPPLGLVDLPPLPLLPPLGPVVRTEPKVGRNDPCPCGSGRKFKKCHGA